MTIDESIIELEKARDSIEPCLFIDEAIDQSMKVAIEVMRKYQKIQEIANDKNINGDYLKVLEIRMVLEDGNDD